MICGRLNLFANVMPFYKILEIAEKNKFYQYTKKFTKFRRQR
jgi:hypothetical protein